MLKFHDFKFLDKKLAVGQVIAGKSGGEWFAYSFVGEINEVTSTEVVIKFLMHTGFPTCFNGDKKIPERTEERLKIDELIGGYFSDGEPSIYHVFPNTKSYVICTNGVFDKWAQIENIGKQLSEIALENAGSSN
ncbi:MAG: hypothetical protein WC878_08025 [Candidatus Paceibacterota bacterium]|jgi:hypothetical protein